MIRLAGVIMITMLAMLNIGMAAVMALAQAQGQANLVEVRRALDSLMTCESPCLMGIQMGMNRDVALRILEGHEWVGEVSTEFFTAPDWSLTNVRWTWSGAQPSFIDTRADGFMQTETFDEALAEFVVTADIKTILRVDDLAAVLGVTEYGSAYLNTDLAGRPLVVYSIDYLDRGARILYDIETQIYCPFNMLTYWNVAGGIGITSYTGRDPFVPLSGLSAICDG